MADGPLEPPTTDEDLEWACEQKWLAIQLETEAQLEYEQEQEWELALAIVAKPA